MHGRFRDDFLARRLDLDCARMKVNAELFEVLRLIRAEAMVVIATATWTASPAPSSTPATAGGD